VFRARALLAAAVAAAGVATALFIPAQHDTAEAAIGGITWSDEFNAAAGTPVDSSKWNFDIGGSGWGNQEREYYTNSTNNVVQDGQGNLVITARRENPGNYQCHYGTCEFTSGRILTNGRFTQRYGRYEARLKVPSGQGIWPAFWLLGDNLGSVGWPQSGEIDIMENIGREPNTVHGTLHGPGYSGGAGITAGRAHSAPLSADFHTYRIDWSPNLVVWYFDDIEYHRVTPANIGGNQWVFDHPFYIILNVAVGGAWPGFPDGTSTYPQSMTVDYVRVSAYTDAAVTQPPATQPPGTQPPVTQPPVTQPPAGANAWAPYTSYTVGQIVTYNGASYRVQLSHTSYPGWEPPNVPALFTPM
jgi:beta-glucanase (GH16 family)